MRSNRSKLCVLVHAFLVSMTALAAQQAAPEGKPRGRVNVPGLDSLTITGEYRLRFEEVYNYDLNEKRSDDRDFFTQRLRLSFNARVNDRIRAFFQIQDVRNWGEETNAAGGEGTTDDSADGLDLHQGYVELRGTPIGGTGRLGRQELAFGDERLVGALGWASQSRAFDGYRHTWAKKNSHTTDLFVTNIKERLTTPTSPVYSDAFFGGIYSTMQPNEEAEFDLYALFLNDEEVVSTTPASGGNEKRVTLGMRFEQLILDGLELGTELASQAGQIGGQDIRLEDTYTAHVHATWTFDAASAPWVKVELNYATGDDPNTRDDERFKNLFPTAHKHWGILDFALWENTLHGMFEVGLKPSERSRLAASVHLFEADEVTDRFVGPVGRISPAGAPAGTSNNIGTEIDLIYNQTFDTAPAKSFLQLGYGIFLPRSGTRAIVGEDNPAHFFYLMTGLKF